MSFALGYTVGSKRKNKHQKTAMFGKLWRSFGQTYIRFCGAEEYAIIILNCDTMKI